MLTISGRDLRNHNFGVKVGYEWACKIMEFY